MATVTDDPLDKKVEMTNWEQVRSIYYITDRARNLILRTGTLHQL